jgi:hypothetical protein
MIIPPDIQYSDEWSKLSSDEFKQRLYEQSEFPSLHLDEVASSDITFLNVVYGKVPEGMSMVAFVDILGMELFTNYRDMPLPLFPIVHEAWTGCRVAEWLISAGITTESKRRAICGNLDGLCFVQGRVKGILSDDELKDLCKRLEKKVTTTFAKLWILRYGSPGLRFIIDRHFGVDLEYIALQHYLLQNLISALKIEVKRSDEGKGE